MGNPWVLLSIPIPATHRSQAMGHSGYRFHQGINKNYIYLIIYFTTIIKPPYKQACIGMGWITGGLREKKRKGNSPGDECLLGLSPHCWSSPPSPIPFDMAGYVGSLDVAGGGVPPCHALIICSPHHLLLAIISLPLFPISTLQATACGSGWGCCLSVWWWWLFA